MLSAADQEMWTRVRDAQRTVGVSDEAAQRDQVERVQFFPWLNALFSKLLDRQKSLWKAYYMTWLRSALYYDGRQILVERDGGQGFGYDIYRMRGMDHQLYVYNRLRPYSDDVTAMWQRASPEVLYAVFEYDQRRAGASIFELNLLHQHFNRLHFTEKNLQMVAKQGQFCGNYHFEVWFDSDARDGQEWYEERGPLEMPASTWVECLECGDLREGDMARCQSCGSEVVAPTTMPAISVPDAVKKAEGWRPAGEVAVRLFPAWSLRYSLVTGADLSPWRYAEEDLPREVIEARYGKLGGTSMDARWGQDELMHPERIMRRAARQRGGGGAWESGEDDLDCVLTQRYWLDPEMLAFIALQEPVQLPNGQQIPPGERLADVFPTGLCVMTAPGLPRFLDVYPESHRERWVDGQYGLTPGVRIGHGIEDAVEAQRHRNVLKSGTFRYLQKTLQPSVAVNTRVFKSPNLFNRVDNVIPIAHGNLPDGTHVGHHFAHVTPPPINPQVFAYIQDADADLQAALKAYNSSGDFAGISNETATAAEIGLARQTSAHNLYLALYAGTVKEVSMRRLKLAQRHYQNLRLVHEIDALSGDRQARVISRAFLDTSFFAWVKTGSYLPNLQIEKRAEFLEGLNAVTALQGAGLLNPGSLRQVNETFQVDFSFERQRERHEECEEAVDLMLQAFQSQEGAVDPAQLYALMPVDPYTLNHQARIHWYRDYLGSREGRVLPPAVREAVIMRIQAHYAALVEEQQLVALAANAGQMLLGAIDAPVGGAPAAGPAGVAPAGDGIAQSLDENPLAADPLSGARPVAARAGRPMR